MPIKTPTKWEIAKPLLEQDYLNGVVTDEMARAEVHGKRDEHKAVPIDNFGENWLRMKRATGRMKRDATRDAAALQHDRLVHPIDTSTIRFLHVKAKKIR